MELRYIQKDAHEAGRNAQGMGDQRGINKYADQVNDASTVLAYRRAGGKSDAPSDALASGPKSASIPVHDSMATITAPSATDAPGYYSRVSAKGGRVLGSYGPQASHEEAAKEAFAKHPNAKTVSTSRGKFGMDIRFHDRGNTKF